jgi:Ca2+-binding RTX toxin-like protein
MTMAIIRGTTGDDTIQPEPEGGNSDGVTVINPPPGSPFSGDVDDIASLAGTDLVDGGLGDDIAVLGDGDDTFRWDPGEGSDDVEGGRGTDTLLFNGDGVENFTISDSANPDFDVDLLRDLGPVLMELQAVERIELNAFEGDDTVDASGLTQDTTALIVNGGVGNDTATLGPADDRFIWNPGDGDDIVDGGDDTDTGDTLEFNGSGGNEEFVIRDLEDGRVELFRDAGSIEMDLDNIERIELNGLDGNDDVDAAELTQDVRLFVDAGGGDDSVFAGPEDDEVRGGAGSDIMFGGAGGDTFAFGAETGDGTPDFDTIGDYDEAEGDVVDLSESGGLVSSATDAEGLSLTLGGGDNDQVFLAGVDSLDDVNVVLPDLM